MKPRVGCLGLGWIGRLRLQALAESGVADVVAIADPSADALDAAHAIVPAAQRASTRDELLDVRLDGLVIATPSGQHATDTIAALERGLAVFCQKPLARSAAEAAAVVRTAERADRLLAVDLCYRETRAARALKGIVDSGELGEIYLADLTFHNSYGPDKDWYYRRSLAGGGCVMDLGVHLVDQLIWLLDPEDVTIETSRLYRNGVAWTAGQDEVEDRAVVQIAWERGTARMACSWNAPTGQDAAIAIELTGTRGAGRMRNVDGSFYDFVTEHVTGTTARTPVSPPDAWGGRALVAWAEQLGTSPSYRRTSADYVRLASVLDAIYTTAAHTTVPPNSMGADPSRPGVSVASSR